MHPDAGRVREKSWINRPSVDAARPVVLGALVSRMNRRCMGGLVEELTHCFRGAKQANLLWSG